jgi:ATP-grasp in the biosynthetic pathway with Ter operon
MDKKNILVFPCGSEVALEIFRSLEFSKSFKLFGANSISDHGKFVFPNYVGDLPFYNDSNFIDCINQIVDDYSIDVIYPAMDSLITFLKENENKLKCSVISSEFEAVQICNSKRLTYQVFSNVLPTPLIFDSLSDINFFPVFLKPDIGYGSRGTFKADNAEEANFYFNKNPKNLILEYLPGDEFTIDCFTNYRGELMFVGPRKRNRVSNGISVNTYTMSSDERFTNLATLINKTIKLNGGWFFQVKERSNNELVLMEIASRFGGSSSVYRAKGINFAELTVLNHYKIDTRIICNEFRVEMDRALNNIFLMDIYFKSIYVDLDDTLLINGTVNYELVALIYKYKGLGKEIILITRHTGELNLTLIDHRLENLFDEIYHLRNGEKKSKFIKSEDAIFIDDSFAEREDVFLNCKIPVFDVSMISGLLNSPND